MTVTIDRPRLLVASALVLALVASLVVGTAPWRAGAAPGDSDATYVPITPCRLFDFRPGADNVGPRNTPLGPAQTHTQQITGAVGNCTIPAHATAVAMNVTAAKGTAASHLRIFPANAPLPLASSLNWSAGQSATPNKVDATLSPTGAIKLYNQAGTVYVLADAVGYYTPSSLTELDDRLAAVEAHLGNLPPGIAVGSVSTNGTLSAYSIGIAAASRAAVGNYTVTLDGHYDYRDWVLLTLDGTSNACNGGSLRDSTTSAGFGSDVLRVRTFDDQGVPTDCAFAIAVIRRIP